MMCALCPSGSGATCPSVREDKGLTGQFWAELDRRGVIRAGGTYIVISLLLLMSVPYANTVVALPEWVNSALLAALAVGFPIAIYMAWSFERSPEGFVRTTSSKSWQNPYGAAQRKPLTGRFIIAALALLVVVMYLYPRYVAPERPPASSENITSANASDKSIAVIPFVNISNDPNQEYFSLGIMEAILNHLVKMDS